MIGYRIRPYEVVPGSTNAALEASKKLIHDAFADPKEKSLFWALVQTRRNLMNVKVDRTIVKPKVSIIGEFWAMTTEGDGNYGLQQFLEAEGAECDIQPVTAWILFMIWEQTWDTQQRMVLRGEDKARKGLVGKNVRKKLVMLWLAKHAIKGISTASATHGPARRAPVRHGRGRHAAAPFYNNHLRGGEGHMEVGKLILNIEKKKATMTLSVKPFGCMPSAGVSDGVQSIITEKYPQGIFCAIETNGDGAVNVYSRVQMMLFKARLAAKEEYKKTAQRVRPLPRGDARLSAEQALARLVAVLSAPRDGGQHGGQPGAARGRRLQEDAHREDPRLHQARALAPFRPKPLRGRSSEPRACSVAN